MGNIITSAKCQMMDIINHIENISFDLYWTWCTVVWEWTCFIYAPFRCSRITLSNAFTLVRMRIIMSSTNLKTLRATILQLYIYESFLLLQFIPYTSNQSFTNAYSLPTRTRTLYKPLKSDAPHFVYVFA